MKKLIGSTTSPFVRRIRLLLAEEEYIFETLKALTAEGMKRLSEFGPVKRIPILIDDERTIFDSTIISEYLLDQRSIQLSIDEKLTLKLVDELCDSSIILFQQKIWAIDPKWQSEFSKRNFERANSILNKLDELQKSELLTELQKDWLYCVLDWLSYRSVIDWSTNRVHLKSMYTSLTKQEKYQATKP